jgi:hypothetical protein
MVSSLPRLPRQMTHSTLEDLPITNIGMVISTAMNLVKQTWFVPWSFPTTIRYDAFEGRWSRYYGWCVCFLYIRWKAVLVRFRSTGTDLDTLTLEGVTTNWDGLHWWVIDSFPSFGLVLMCPYTGQPDTAQHIQVLCWATVHHRIRCSMINWSIYRVRRCGYQDQRMWYQGARHHLTSLYSPRAWKML